MLAGRSEGKPVADPERGRGREKEKEEGLEARERERERERDKPKEGNVSSPGPDRLCNWHASAIPSQVKD